MGNICSSCEEEKKKANAVIQPARSTTSNKHHAMKEIILSEDKFLSACNKKIKMNDDSVTVPPSNNPTATRLDYPLEISQQYSLTFDDNNSRSRIDSSKKDYRAFCLLIHRKQGAVILHCTRKKRKPPHYQLPGGHVDDIEFKQVTKSLSNLVTQEQLYYASRIGCAREVYEETGIDFRNRLDELLPMVLYNKEDFKNEEETLINEFKSRIFFVCEIVDEDFPHAKRSGSMTFSTIRYPSLPNDFSCDLMLQLSVEHSGYRFVKDSREIAKSLKLHSGGKVEKAVELAFNL